MGSERGSFFWLRLVMVDSTMGRFTARVQNVEAETHGVRAMLQGETLEGKFAKLERDDRVDRLLEELKEKRLLEA